jgi:hypothetical protein
MAQTCQWQSKVSRGNKSKFMLMNMGRRWTSLTDVVLEQPINAKQDIPTIISHMLATMQ